jgi:hypothetical protein
MNDRQLTDGSPVPEDGSHREINPATGMQRGYVVLSPEERAKGFVKPVRRSYLHAKCGNVTTMGLALAETYARNPHFYSGTMCVACRAHFPLNEFTWEPDGEPMDPALQEAWHKARGKNETHRRLEVNPITAENLGDILKRVAQESGPITGGLVFDPSVAVEQRAQARMAALEARIVAIEQKIGLWSLR